MIEDFSERKLIFECPFPLAARMLDQSGVDGLWISGLTTAALNGYSDTGEMPWSILRDHARAIRRQTATPIYADIDTGYGDFIIARNLAKELADSGVNYIVLEDKVFPKSNSFTDGVSFLEDEHIVTDKIKAIVEHTDGRVKVIARCEGLCIGRSQSEVLSRAEKYVNAGADGIFIHSKKTQANEIYDFLHSWNDISPVYVAPTTYGKSTDVSNLFLSGAAGIIWANHTTRAILHASKYLFAEYFSTRSLDLSQIPLLSIEELLHLSNTKKHAEERLSRHLLDKATK